MKHAFLIMAHNEPYILNKLLKKLSHPNNDCYVHIDKKVNGFYRTELETIIKKAGGIIIKNPIDARWGDFSLIRSELLLFTTALNSSIQYDYFHLLSGVDLPIKPMSYIHSFFECNKGKEFFRIVTDSNNMEQLYIKTNYYHFFMYYKRKTIGKLLRFLNIPKCSIRIQIMLHISRYKTDNLTQYKGDQWCSLSREAVQYILSKTNYIYKRYKYTSCPDEIYKQTILMNSRFKSKRFESQENSINDSLREIDWSRGTLHIWNIQDKNILLNSKNLFARKFSSKNTDIIDFIASYI